MCSLCVLLFLMLVNLFPSLSFFTISLTSPLLTFLNTSNLGAAPNIIIISISVSPLFSTALGTLNGSHPLIPLLLCVTVFVLGVKATRLLSPLPVLL
eukprot:g38360.t1